jgi:SAM-dependent methyltransferase
MTPAMRPLGVAMRRGAAALALCLAAPGALRAQDEVPFVVTPDNVTLAMLELAQVGPSDFVLDLGSGDGRIVILAARRFGARGLGVEIVPDLVERSRRNALQAGVAERARFIEQDLFKTELSVATVITMYLLQDVNLQLRPALAALQPGTRIVSHDWDLGDWRPDRSVTVDAPDKPVGKEKRSRLHLWVVPARLAGAWCGAGEHRGARLQLAQRHQVFDATLSMGAGAGLLAGRVDGTRLRGAGGFEAMVDGARLRVTQAGDASPALLGAEFERCPA